MVKNPEISNRLRHTRKNMPILVDQNKIARCIQECILRRRKYVK
jgi:hypothetical protein